MRKALLDAPEKIYVVPFMSEYFGVAHAINKYEPPVI